MSKVLFLTSSLFGEHSKSRAVAIEFLDAWRRTEGGAKVAVRDISAIPHLSGDVLQGLAIPEDQRSEEQRRAVALADALIAELEAADTIVIAAPMYNFSIPSALKAWLDHVARAGRTFRYSQSGPEGLIKGKTVIVAIARGGVYSGEGAAKAMDFQEPYLKFMLGFIGLTDVTFIRLEGLNMGPEAAAQGWSSVHEQIAQAIPPARAA